MDATRIGSLEMRWRLYGRAHLKNRRDRDSSIERTRTNPENYWCEVRNILLREVHREFCQKVC